MSIYLVGRLELPTNELFARQHGGLPQIRQELVVEPFRWFVKNRLPHLGQYIRSGRHGS